MSDRSIEANETTEVSFEQLQERLVDMYQRIFPDPLAKRTVVVVPSLTLDTTELAKIDGVHHYEERMLFLLMLLQMPRTRLIYLSSQPIAESIIDYLLHMLPGIPSIHARRRLTLLACHDGSNLPLAQKILDRPRILQKIKTAIPNPADAHITCFTATHLERELALQLGIPLYATNPDHSHYGSKSGSREIFREAGILMPPGFENIKEENEIAESLSKLKTAHPEMQKAVVKLNEGFSGEGNAIFRFDGCPEQDLEAWVASQLPKLEFEAASETWENYRQRFREMQGIVEGFVVGEEKSSPSVQCRINPLGEVEIVSTHDQILGGPSGQVFLGCDFPANIEYRLELQEAGRRVGNLLRDRGVIGRFAVDFVSVKTKSGWEHYAIEINLRKGGTTHTFMMLQFLTNGRYDEQRGEFLIPGGESRCYFASDNLRSDSYKGLTPDDLIDIAVMNDLHFHSTIQQGVVFHLIGALSEFGKLGVVCIGDTTESARSYYDQTLTALES